MKTLIVHESLFGNTKAVADAIERGLVRGTEPGEVGTMRSDEAPGVIPEDVGLLIVGGPTHAFSMTRESTRKDAETKGADAHVGSAFASGSRPSSRGRSCRSSRSTPG